MPTLILQQNGSAIILANSGDHGPAAANNLGTRTDQINLTSLAAGSYRQSAKIDFGLDRAAQWSARAVYEWSTAPTAGNVVNLFISFSNSATAATANDGGASGADAAYNGYGAAATDADEAVQHLLLVGPVPVTNDATAQVGNHGIFTTPERYGNIIVHNDTDQAFIANGVEMSIRLVQIEDEIQD